MRVLLTWELGLNLGHLTRLLPIAQQLRLDGHVVLAAVRDIQTAAAVLGPAGIPFIPAPHLSKGIPLTHRATGYADILLSQGWADGSALWALTQGWLTLFQLFKPDRLVLDYSPSVGIAARIAKIHTVLIGNGFELPPLTDPLPPFPGFSWATAEKAARSEARAVTNANNVLRIFKERPISALRELVLDQKRLFATYRELDHYGPREDANYIGPLLGELKLPNVAWPDSEGPRVFACIRPDTACVKAIMDALTEIKARVVCVASGFSESQLEPLQRAHIRLIPRPINLQCVRDADLCLTYGAEGTMTRLLTFGIPLLISPWHVEAFMAARRIHALALGRSLPSPADKHVAVEMITAMCADDRIRGSAEKFAKCHLPLPSETMTAVLSAINDQADSIVAKGAGDNRAATWENRKSVAGSKPIVRKAIASSANPS